MDDISNILNEVFAAYNDIENKKYAPIHNSHMMLQKIREYYEGNIKSLDEGQIDKINVGLLSAKALDFDERFTAYAQLLHNAWGSFLSFLSTSYSKYPYSIPSSGPKKQAYDFYINQGFTDNQAKDHMQGVDFSKSVDSNFTLRKNDIVVQWRHPNIVQGDYYSEIGSTPNCLGVHDEQEDCQGNRAKRTEHKFSLLKDVTCLKSYAANVLDTWSIRNQYFLVKGGCIQYFNKSDRNQFHQRCP